MGLLKTLGIGKYLKKVKDYTDEQIENLVGSAPETLNTIHELAAALKNNKDIVDTLNGAITDKASKSELNTEITKVEETIVENEKATADALADLDTKLNDKLSIIESTITDNEEVTAGAFVKLNSRISNVENDVIENKEVTTNALNDLDNKIITINNTVIENNEVTTNTLTDINTTLADLNEKVENIEISGVSGDSPLKYGDAKYSAVMKGEYEGYSNKAISQTSMAVGAATTAGLKGWYYSAIDFSNKKITLSDTPTYILVDNILLNGSWLSGTPNIEVGDVISLVNNSKYDFCSKVIAVNGNVITVDSLPFDGLVQDSGAAVAVLAGQFSDGYSVYIPDRPNAGIIDFGGGAFSEGGQSKATNVAAHAEGIQTHAYGQFSHAEGRETKAGYAAHAEGWETVASGEDSHSEGYQTTASGKHAHSEGAKSRAEGPAAHAEGQETISSGNYSHSEGYKTTASGSQSHAEGNGTIASNNQSHAEGNTTIASGKQSHAEGLNTTASGLRAHAEGLNTTASGAQSHAEGQETVASGDYSHAGGLGTKAKNPSEVAFGKYNISVTNGLDDESELTLFTLGIGRNSNERKNAVEVKQNGDVYITGIGGFTGANSGSSKSVQEVINELVYIINQITIKE